MKKNQYFCYTESTSTPEETLMYLKNYYPLFYQIVMQEKFAPNTLDDVNYFLLQNYFNVKQDGFLECEYFKNNRDEKRNISTSIIITKNNFYNAYTQKIWKNLSLKSKIQVIFWHFLCKCDEINAQNVSFRIIENDGDLVHNTLKGSISKSMQKYALFVQIINSLGNENDFLTICMSMEHEFEHIKQFSTRRHNLKHRDDLNLYEFDILYGLNGEFMFKDINLSDAMYRISPVEMSAENRAIKNCLKYLNANEQVFGKLAEDRKQFKKFLKDNSRLWLRTPPSQILHTDIPDSKKQAYKKSYKVAQDKVYLLKLCALEKVLKDKLDFASTKEEQDKLSKKIKTVNGLIRLYEKKQQKASLTEDFFEELPFCEDEKTK